MFKQNTLSTGKATEVNALKYLLKKGLTLITQNYSKPIGEIDLIMLDKQTLCFIEVRLRKNSSYGNALASVTPIKQQKIIKTANYFLLENSEYNNQTCRFDVIGYDGRSFDWVQVAFF